MNIVCIGSGYVGSVTAAAFASLGHHMIMIDSDSRKVEAICAGFSPIYEPGLDQLMAASLGRSLNATTAYDSVKTADAVFICVGTPARRDGGADLAYVKNAAEQIGRVLAAEHFTVIVMKSTVPVGTCDLVSSIIEKVSGLTVGREFAVVSNPEFLREGFALEDVFFPDRIVVGVEDSRAAALMREIYNPILQHSNYELAAEILGVNELKKRKKPVYYETDPKSSELIKYASNAFLAVKISYINEVARLAEALGVNGPAVAEGMGLDTRIGSRFLSISPGWSGSCFPKDTLELMDTGRKYNREMMIVEAAVTSNERMQLYCLEKLQRQLRSLNGRTIGILGLTFKPDTDDARTTQASFIISRLLEYGARVQAHDPKGMEMFRSIHQDLHLEFVSCGQEVADRADAILLLTHWEEYLKLDWAKMAEKMRQRYVLDTRNFLPGPKLKQYGFIYEGLGLL